jgi:hypothetical protein
MVRIIPDIQYWVKMKGLHHDHWKSVTQFLLISVSETHGARNHRAAV